jgi:hypothetical protein
MFTREELLQRAQGEYPELTPDQQVALIEFVMIHAPQLVSISVVATTPRPNTIRLHGQNSVELYPVERSRQDVEDFR